MSKTVNLPIIDLSLSDKKLSAGLIRQACLEHGFFYLVNHGVEEELVKGVFAESKKFFSLSLEDKMKLLRRDQRGYSPLYAEKLDTSLTSKGDSKESFYIGPFEGIYASGDLNQWPPEEILPSWRSTMQKYHKSLLSVGRQLLHLVALSLSLDATFFEEIGALNNPAAFVRLLHYPGHLGLSDEETYGASAHSDYGMITLLATDGVPGLQVCKDKDKHPRVWEDVPQQQHAFVVNVGDMMERWTNGLYRSTLHRVVSVGQERYSVAFFLDPNPDCVVECLESCYNELCPPKFAPIRSIDYLKERFRLTYGS